MGRVKGWIHASLVQVIAHPYAPPPHPAVQPKPPPRCSPPVRGATLRLSPTLSAAWIASRRLRSWGTLTSSSAASPLSVSTIPNTRSFQYVSFARWAWREAMWLSSGGGESGASRPVRTPPMNTWYGIIPTLWSEQGVEQLALYVPLAQVVLRLNRLEPFQPALIAHPKRSHKLPCSEVRAADMAYLALPNHVVQRTESPPPAGYPGRSR